MMNVTQFNKQLEREQFKRKYTFEITPEWTTKVVKSWGHNYDKFEIRVTLAGHSYLFLRYYDTPDDAMNFAKFHLQLKYGEYYNIKYTEFRKVS